VTDTHACLKLSTALHVLAKKILIRNKMVIDRFTSTYTYGKYFSIADLNSQYYLVLKIEL